jgi:hypothetical protein
VPARASRAGVLEAVVGRDDVVRRDGDAGLAGEAPPALRAFAA